VKGRVFFVVALLSVVTILSAGPAHAQFAGHNTKGDYGLQSGSQPPPGVYVVPMYYRYDGDSVKNRNGDSVRLDPEGRGSRNYLRFQRLVSPRNVSSSLASSAQMGNALLI
jgi:hypothetical protein